MTNYWIESDQKAAEIAAEAKLLPKDDTDPATDAKLKDLESRAKRLGYNDRAFGDGGRTWTPECSGFWFGPLNEAYDEGMTQWEDENL